MNLPIHYSEEYKELSLYINLTVYNIAQRVNSFKKNIRSLDSLFYFVP